ncbi:MAG: hypothetical protein K0R53_278 [Burkholderiales bacterium]|jgi:hypothetical protein|nr:hypothetical protein [Burkholderiales bacterium]
MEWPGNLLAAADAKAANLLRSDSVGQCGTGANG